MTSWMKNVAETLRIGTDVSGEHSAEVRMLDLPEMSRITTHVRIEHH
jgi:hypothetical protein